MNNYSVVLFGNRRGATIKKDYVTHVTKDYSIIEIRGQCLSITSFTDKQAKAFIENNNTID